MRKTTKIFFLIIFIWVALSAFSIVNAASAEITAKPTKVTVGEKVTVTVKVNAAAWNLKVSGSASGKIIGYNGEGINESTTKTYTIDTSKEGTYTVSLSGDVTDQSKNTPDIINKSVSITVEPKKTDNGGSNNGTTNNNTGGNNNTTTNNNTGTTTTAKSTNAYLSTLGVTPKEYDFSGFKKTSLTYSVTVPYEVDELKVLYKTAHSGAKVKVTGNSGFEVGSNNKITVKVTAEDGKTTKTYTIKVTKLAEEEDKPGNIIEDPEGLCLTSLSIKGVEISPEFSKDVYAYTATLSDTAVTEVEVNAVANKEGATIEVSGNTDLVVGENTINIVVKQANSTVQAVYQVTLTKEAALNTINGEDTNFMSNLIDNIKNYVIIAVIVVILIIVAIVILIILLKKENKKLKNEETEEEYNVYENDENEFENNEVKDTVEETKKIEKEEVTNETETKNVRRTRRKEKGRHSK